MQNENYNEQQGEVFSKVVKAGKRTYFIDIKETRGKDYYITLTESKKVATEGRDSFQKHKLFLYKEDFVKFKEALEEVMERADNLNRSQESSTRFSHDISFEDL